MRGKLSVSGYRRKALVGAEVAAKTKKRNATVKSQTLKRLTLIVPVASVATGTMLGSVEAAQRKRGVMARSPQQRVLEGKSAKNLVTGFGHKHLFL